MIIYPFYLEWISFEYFWKFPFSREACSRQISRKLMAHGRFSSHVWLPDPTHFQPQFGMHQCIDGRALADGEIEWNCMCFCCDKKSTRRLDADPKKQTLCQFKGLNPEIQVLMILSLYKWQYGCF